LPADPEVLTQFFTIFGYAVWHAQALEHTLAHYVVLSFRIHRPGSQADLDRAFHGVRKMTLGGLIADLRERPEVSPDLTKRLGAFVNDDRNWLAHRMYYEHHADLFSGAKAAALASRVEAIGDRALALNKEIGALLDRTVLAWGVPKADFEAQAKKLFESWRDDV
jgi:hypothetical protein